MQGDAEAITFGNSIFFSSSPPTARTFVHEMVHIDQYARLGRAGFLESYFGMSLLTIIKRAIAREPINVMMSSPCTRRRRTRWSGGSRRPAEPPPGPPRQQG